MQARAQDDKGDAPAKAESIEITARPIAHFERGRPDVKRFGELEFRGGLVLTSPSTHFGGWSDLIVEADGNSLFAISDVGGWLSADIKYRPGTGRSGWRMRASGRFWRSPAARSPTSASRTRSR